VQAYFTRSGPDGRPAYVEFRIGDSQAELGLIDRRFQPITSRGEAVFVTAAVISPFGNVLGVMYNPHYLDVAVEKA
jgi:hypothetical protein